MRTYKAISGQTLADICMNTYGSMDYFYTLLQDSGVYNADQVPYTGQEFIYNETLIVDSSVNKTTTINNIRYATAFSNNGNTYYVTQGGPSNIINNNPPYVPPPTNTSMYQKTSASEFTSASVGGETIITLPSLAGKDIIQLEKNIQVLETSQYQWNKTTFTLTLQEPIYKDEKLFILVTEMITV